MGTKKGQCRKTARKAYMKKKKKPRKKKKGFFDFDIMEEVFEDIAPKMNFYRSKEISEDRKRGGQ